MGSLTELSQEIHLNAREHGWWDDPRGVPEVIALCHSELSEALEEYRNDKPQFYIENGKPEGIATELVDCIIRILDYLSAEGVNVDHVMAMKMEYNKTRPYRHGGKKA